MHLSSRNVTLRSAGPLLLVCALVVVLAGCGSGGGLIATSTFSVNGRIVDAYGNPLANVTILYTGGSSGQTVTDGSGAFAIVGLRGTVVITPVLQGWTFEPASSTVRSSLPGLAFTAKEDKPEPRYFTVSVEVGAGGRVTLDPEKQAYLEGESIVVRAVPDQGYAFAGWSGDHTTYAPSFVVSIDCDKHFSAMFTPYDPNEVIEIQDRELESAIRDEINRQSGSITLGDLSLVTQLNLVGAHLTDITPLIHATYLTRLDLGHAGIEDLTPLSGLVNLEWLNLRDNLIRDVSPLSDLASLEYLDLEGNYISDLTPLRNLRDLRHLDLADNYDYTSSTGIQDLSPLASLPMLEILSLNYNYLTDLSPLASMTSLRSLSLEGNYVHDLRPLEGMINLEWLNLRDNYDYTAMGGISDLAPLRSLTGLRWLDLSTNRLTSLSELSVLTQLEVVYADDNEITDLQPLAELKTLRELYVSLNHGLTSLSPLAGLTGLSCLDLSSTGVRDLTPLADLPLGHLYLAGTESTLDVTNPQNSSTLSALESRGCEVSFDFRP